MFIKFNKFSIKIKLILFILIINVISASFIIFIRNKQNNRLLERIIKSQTRVILNSLNYNITKELELLKVKEKLDKRILEKYAQKISKEEEIDYIIFQDLNKNIIAFNGEISPKEMLNNLDFEKKTGFKNNIFITTQNIISKKGNIIGKIILGFSLRNSKKIFHKDLMDGLKLLILSNFFIIFFIYLVLTYFLKPLDMLYKAAIRVSKTKDFNSYLPVSTNDEIGKISEEFNKMVKELKSFYLELEDKVNEATNELQITNEKLNKRTAELENLNLELKEMDSRKSEFVSIVAHDLRTPLTSILGFAETLLKKNLNLNELQKEQYLNIIRNESRRLGRLISDFLDITKIESGVLELKLEETNIRKHVEWTVETAKINSKGIDFIIESDPDIPEIKLDRDRIRQVLQNLIGNAIKYSRANSVVKILIKYSKEEISVSIIDQGPGIADEEKEKIFRKFYRIDDDISKKERGAGLGLAIAKAIIVMHGGKIWVENNYPSGSCFKIVLPFKNKGQ